MSIRHQPLRYLGLAAVAGILVLLLAACQAAPTPTATQPPAPTTMPQPAPPAPAATTANAASTPTPKQDLGTVQNPLTSAPPPGLQVVVQNLETVWEIAFAPDGRMFFTERAGRIQMWDGSRLQLLITLPVEQVSESGLMGLALDPAFPAQPFVYTCYTYRSPTQAMLNRVERLRLEGASLTRDRILLDNMKGAMIHDGCRVRFAPDGKLLVTMGETGQAPLAQDLGALNGKVFRINSDGTVPADNPFAPTPAFTLGHRNPQGLDFRPGTGQAYISEHGPDTDDEINRLIAGRNYGWPTVRGKAGAPQFEPALWTWTPTIAPAGIAFTSDTTLFMATLKEQRLHRLTLSADGLIIADDNTALIGRGRLRALAKGADGCLYVGTSNRDGRGTPQPGDDKILRLCQ